MAFNAIWRRAKCGENSGNVVSSWPKMARFENSPLPLGARGRWFKSSQPDHYLSNYISGLLVFVESLFTPFHLTELHALIRAFTLFPGKIREKFAQRANPANSSGLDPLARAWVGS